MQTANPIDWIPRDDHERALRSAIFDPSREAVLPAVAVRQPQARQVAAQQLSYEVRARTAFAEDLELRWCRVPHVTKRFLCYQTTDRRSSEAQGLIANE
jgi:hypothetical protein